MNSGEQRHDDLDQAHQPVQGKIVDIDVSTEMKSSFLEYAYSVIYARALPDARDGLKPVQRRILFQMDRMGLSPEKGHVKSSRVVGDVMGRLHPHGDSAIYDALVRLAQPFTMELPLVDGHGNFGSLDDGPAAPRYTEARLTAAAMAMNADLDEDVVDFVPNYDNQFMQPSVLPAAFPNLLVNGASGIAVGMATNIAPHNLLEVSHAAVHLLDNPAATLDELMEYCPGPDLPGGGVIVGLDGIRQAYEGGRGTFYTRARASIEQVTARKRGIVITELPYLVGPERVATKLKEAVSQGKVKGVSGWQDLSDRKHGMRLVVEVKTGFNPEAVLAQLYKHTPLEDSFGINAVAIVEGQPRTLGLRQALQVFLDHRLTVTERRCRFRLEKRRERAHLVAGLLLAVLNIDEVIQVIRSSDDAQAAQQRLCQVFDLSVAQADYLLALRLRRLTKFSRLELEAEADQLAREIAELEAILADEEKLRALVRSEILQTAQKLGTPRKTLLLDEDGQVVSAKNAPTSALPAAPQVGLQVGLDKSAVPLEVADEPAWVLLSSEGGLGVVTGNEPLARQVPRVLKDTLIGAIHTTTRSQVGILTSTGFLVKVDTLTVPRLSVGPQGQVSLVKTTDVLQLGPFEAGEVPVGIIALSGQGGVDSDQPGQHPSGYETGQAAANIPLALVTAQGTIKRVRQEFPARSRFEVISLLDQDRVVYGSLGPDSADFVLLSSDGQLLRTSARQVRPQGRLGRGVAGMALRDTSLVIAGAVINENELSQAEVVTVASAAGALEGTGQTSAKVTPLDRYPTKGRGSQGVRAQRFLKGESLLAMAWIGIGPARAVDASGKPVDLPPVSEKRDGSGEAIAAQIAYLG